MDRRKWKKWICAALAAAIFILSQTAYFKSLDALPQSITLPMEASLDLTLPFGVTLRQSGEDFPVEVLSSKDQTLGTQLVANSRGVGNASFELFGVLPVRGVEICVVQSKTLAVSGDLIGIAMLTDGALVVGTSRVMDEEGIWQDPAGDAGIEAGDIVTHIDGQEVENAATISDHLGQLQEDCVTLSVLRGESRMQLQLYPVREIGSGILRLGIWVRDSTAGVGTLTYVDEASNSYGALGHGILDQDTQAYLTVLKGRVVQARVSDIQRGVIGTPGQLHGVYALDQKPLGDVTANNLCGVFGNTLDVSQVTRCAYEIALSSQVQEGPAQLICAADGTTQHYDCVIEDVFRQNRTQTKNMVVRVTDEQLLSLTGGIVQGMSGSPIIQNGKLVGAVTHVLVNDPTRGYGIFIENMLKAAS